MLFIVLTGYWLNLGGWVGCVPKVVTNPGLWRPARVSVVDSEYGAGDNAVSKCF